MRIRVSLAFCFLMLAMSNACTKTSAPEQMLEEARALDKRINDAANRKDLNALMDTIWKSPDLVNLDIDEFVIGHDAWKGLIGKFFTKRPTMIWETSDAHNVVSGDVVLGWERWKETIPGENGSPAKVATGLHMSVKALRDGKWVVLAQAFSEIPQPKSNSAQMIAEAERLDQRFSEAFNKADLVEIGNIYSKSPDTVIIDVDQIFHGAELWKTFLAETFKKFPGMKIAFRDMKNSAAGDNIIIGSGKYTLTLPASKGPARAINGLRTSVKANVDGKWVVLSDTFVHTK